ncbi:putative membrane protein [Tamaricihabitans halophyticus]|uniref:Putative membrane protein n=1 Tax=Tamaricihabitans halophyticus TaxID=1262583 RepID=A0A4R2QEQ7_9PSEU|nr:PH domain-containing protein [Tamaricihabitans halophyticus]TCP46768.1 putative membrane protein [Tamaricihabitans halophyticus]
MSGHQPPAHELPAAPPATDVTDERAIVTDWQRLDRRTIAVTAVYLVGIAVAVGASLHFRSELPGWLIWSGAAVLVIGVVGFDVVHWWKTQYRITEQRFEVHTGVLFRNRRSIPVDRIRSVDSTANPIQRAFGVAVVKIGTGQQTGKDEELKLDALAQPVAERLRARLLTGARQISPAVAAAEPDDAANTFDTDPVSADGNDSAAHVLSRLNWSWIRYAPLTLSSVLAVGLLLAAVYKPLDLIGLNPIESGLVSKAIAEFEAHPLWLSIGAIVLVALVLGVLGSLVLFVESWWRFELTRETVADPNTGGAAEAFRVRRGLLTTRSLTLERRRLRGVEIIEPFLLRLGHGARTHAVATGMSGRNDALERVDTLLPPAPLTTAQAISARVLDEETAPTTALSGKRHPLAALRRRLVWSLTPVLAGCVALWVLGETVSWFPGWPALIALALLPIAALFAVDAYRNLGHGLTERYLVTRSGTGLRSTVALQRTGIIGWRLRRSFFQRRSGLCTITAATAAGSGAYQVRDIGMRDGVLLAERAVPGLLAPFVERMEQERG